MRICIVGAGTRFTSGISYYTIRLANALSESHEVSVIPMRQLLPTRLYPGWRRVGAHQTNTTYAQNVKVFAGVDWYWFPSMVLAILFLIRQRPEQVVFQWWTGTVLHSYLLLTLVARLIGAKMTVEFHEVLDPGELDIPLANIYVRTAAPWFMALAQGFVIHSENDRAILQQRYRIGKRPVSLIYHGPYDQFHVKNKHQSYRAAPVECCNLFFFGLIRPYKGLEDLIKAFDSLSEEQISNYWLTIVGETWEGWTLPAELIATSRYRDRITFVNRYVADEEVAAFFAGADVVVLPYHRSSGSGALHIALNHGLPVVVSHVGGLSEAVVDYQGAILVPPMTPSALQEAIIRAQSMCGQRFADPHSWDHTVQRYHHLFSSLMQNGEAQQIASFQSETESLKQ